jgi:hypothetical protein
MMMHVLTSDVMLRFLGGFGIGCLLVVSGAFDMFSGIA